MTVDNIRDTRFSRNMRIARVLTEIWLGTGLNGGVKRIYSDMAEFFLEDPGIEPSGIFAVRLTLKNNIKVRKLRRRDRAVEAVGSEA